MKNIQEEVKPNWRETIELKRYLSLSHEVGKYDVSDAWIEWVYRMMEEHNQSLKERSELVLLACLQGCLSGLKWLKSKECIVDWKTWEYAGYSGHLKVLEWLRDEKLPWHCQACTGAAKGGHLKVLKWLRSERCPWNAFTSQGAALGGHLEVLKYLHSEGCPFYGEWACQAAARGGHLEVLKYLHDKGCLWDESACYEAAFEGHLEVLKYLHSEGCPWNIEQVRSCSKYDIDISNWLSKIA